MCGSKLIADTSLNLVALMRLLLATTCRVNGTPHTRDIVTIHHLAKAVAFTSFPGSLLREGLPLPGKNKLMNRLHILFTQ
jgi:hypothetical protein